ncbi:Hypothetical protein NTJ_14057 [Nesidiocoris tenuis]|uniref:C-type lectin domain-containing protein n=1 Tax=Nesidiocoris tenuis TaxID=355587 RepID=A0ABN7BA32_9HEMI|nr:Hypothetical protein NTJ_14057 [Nesidiocoris tenuis]
MISPTIATLFLTLASAVLCERTSNPEVMYSCPKKYFRVGNNCYYLSKEKVQWREAIYQCQDTGGTLAVLDTKIEDQKLRRYLNRMKQIKGERWIAGTFDAHNHVWRWAHHSEPFKYHGFSRLRRRGNAWKCVIMDHNMKYRWNSRSCFQKKKYICEQPMETIVLKKKQGFENNQPVHERTNLPNQNQKRTKMLKRRKPNRANYNNIMLNNV